MDILVTGGTGFLGRHLVPTLCRAGHRQRVLTRQPEQHPWLTRYPGVTVVKGDIRDRDAVRHALADCRWVIHAAGLFSMWGAPTAFEQTNVQGTQNVLDIARETGVERLVSVSTVAVIGNPKPDTLIDESYPPDPADPYQASKLEAEGLTLAAHREHDLPAVILRAGAFYGPMGEYAFNRLFFTDARRGLIMQMNGGRHVIFPVYVGDVAQGILAALNHARPGEIYNICGEPLSHKAAFDVICQQANLRWPRLNLPGWLGINVARFLTLISNITGREPFYPINLRSYVFNDWHVSSEKARRELGFEPLPFEEGARRTLAWYQAGQPDHWPELDC